MESVHEQSAEFSHDLLAHASRLLVQTWNQYLTGVGVTYAGYLALSAAAERPIAHQAALAEALHVRTPTIGYTLDRLEHQGHVRTFRRSADMRYRMVRVTTRGHEILRKGQEIERSLLAGAEGLRAQLLQLLPQLLQQPGAA
ncbi:hypothetical protein GCM10027404_33140 [Arthrobacter tumbae]|uniref:MarR family winged helix-turn-helix transcriptional regulator n=1 Tax=Arthrobacter tumbae TaxID=163874 RepID=UPI00195CA370|nr:MarR family transcriptional regulator [Arthrobacter tumbae]MBM7781792.1 DNA-binding MarR family transcriptional regulator [Arthrobacter tumbae]